MWRWLGQERRRFLVDVKGNISVIFALVITAVLVCGGAAIDYAGSRSQKARADAAADAAILAAVKSGSGAIASGKTGWRKIAEAAGTAAFKDNLAADGSIQLGGIVFTLVKSGGSLTGSVSYTASFETTFMRIAGVDQITLANTVSAAQKVASYIDVHFVIDNSPSMAIGATAADQKIMKDTLGCAIACHYVTTHGHTDTVPTARSAGARLRIDIVKDAVQAFISEARSRRQGSEQIRVSIYTYSNTLKQVLAPTTDLKAAETAAGTVELAGYNGSGGTNSAKSLQQLAAKLSPGGDGSTVNRRQSFVVLLTDGVEDSQIMKYASGTSGPFEFYFDDNFTIADPHLHDDPSAYIQSFASAPCAALKSARHNVITAEIEYLIPAGTWSERSTARFDFISDTLSPIMKSEMAACASQPSFAFSAVDSEDIEPMLGEVLDSVLTPSVLRLTK